MEKRVAQERIARNHVRLISSRCKPAPWQTAVFQHLKIALCTSARAEQRTNNTHTRNTSGSHFMQPMPLWQTPALQF